MLLERVEATAAADTKGLSTVGNVSLVPDLDPAVLLGLAYIAER